MYIAADILLFFLVFCGLGLPFTLTARQAPAITRLTIGLAGAFVCCALAGSLRYLLTDTHAAFKAVRLANGEIQTHYLTRAPGTAGLILPCIAVLSLVLFRGEIWRLFEDVRTKIALVSWLVLSLWSAGMLAFVVSYSGGAWNGDWLEHYERSLFFLEHWNSGHRFIDVYSLAARPPLANLACSGLMLSTGADFFHFQILACLLSCLCIVPLLGLLDQLGIWKTSSSPWLLVLLVGATPFWVQNTAVPWTKLPVAFFVLGALLFLAPGPSADIKHPSPHALAPWILMSLGLLVHYSAGPWIMALVMATLVLHRDQWGAPGFWTRFTLPALFSFLICLPWFAWTISIFGLKQALTSNTTSTALDPNWLKQAGIALSNIGNTLVPHLFRAPSNADILLSQTSSLGLARDLLFFCYQVCLPFLWGLSGLFALACLFATRPAWFSSRNLFWVCLATIATVLGCSVHSAHDEWGLAHICLLPLGLLGLLAVCRSIEGMVSWQQRVFWLLLTTDFVLGVVLPILIQSHVLASALGISDAQYAASLSRLATYNHQCKAIFNLVFLGDLTRPFHPWLLALMTFVALLVIRSRMNPSPTRPDKSLHRPLGLALFTGLLAMTACWFLYSTFMVYDDEGYVLYAMHNYSLHGGLYDKVYSQYGPFFHVFADGLHRLGWEISNEGGRLLNLACWLGSSLACFAFVHRVTRSMPAALACMAAVFLHLWSLANEPAHPGGFICLLLALLGLTVFRLERNPMVAGLATGLLAAALLLTKVNIGVFVAAALGAWVLLRLPRSRRLAATAALAGLLLLPWLLMHRLLGEAWVLHFALVSSLSFAAVLISCFNDNAHVPFPRWLPYFLAGGLLLTLLTGTVLLARGSTLQGLLEGTLLGPLRMPTIFTSPVRWRAGTLLLAFLSFGLALWLHRLLPPRRTILLVCLRMLTALAFAICLLDGWPLNSHAFSVNFGLSTAWVFVAPLQARTQAPAALSWLALLGVTQILHAYPVAGSQLSWGSFLWIPLACVGTWEAVGWLLKTSQPVLLWLGRLSAVLLLLLLGTATCNFARLAWMRLHAGSPLALPGAESIVVPERMGCSLRLITRNLNTHCDQVFSMPGMFSLNLWTSLPSPTLDNATHWFSLLDDARQRDIITALSKAQRPGVVVQREVCNFLKNRKISTDSVLSRYLTQEYAPVLSFNTYELWLPKSRQVPLVGSFQVFVNQSAGRWRHSLLLNAGEGLRIARIEWREFHGDGSRLLASWSAAQWQALVTPLAPDGADLSASQGRTGPLNVKGLLRLDLYLSIKPPSSPPGEAVLFLYDEVGNKTGEACLIP